MPDLITISGKVVNVVSGAGVEKLKVEAWDKDFVSKHMVGSAITGEGGSFKIVFDQKLYAENFRDKNPDIYFKVYDGSLLLASTEREVYWNITRPYLEITIKVFPEKQVTAEEFAFSGFVFHTGGNPVAGVKVCLFKKVLGEEVLLSETKTRADGSYAINIEKAINRVEKADTMMIKIMEGEGKEIASSGVFEKQPAARKMNFLVDDASCAGSSAYENTYQSLAPFVKPAQINNIRDNGIRQEYYYLSKVSGVHKKDVEHYISAHKLAAQTEIEPDIFYAFVKEGYAPNAEAILTISPQKMAEVLERASAKNTIKRMSASEINKKVEQMKVIWVNNALNQPQSGENVVSLIKLALPDRDDASQVLKNYALSSAPQEIFWEGMKKVLGDGGGEKIAAVKRVLRLGELAGGQLDVVQELMRLTEGKSGEESVRSFVSWSRDDFKDLIRRASEKKNALCVPTYIDGKNDEEKIETYAYGMVLMLSKAFPTETFIGRLAHASSGNPFGKAQEDIIKFTRQNPGFTLGGTNVLLMDKYDLGGISDPGLLTKEMSAINRLFKLTYDFDKISVLRESGFESSYQITAVSEKTFVDKYKAEMGSATMAADIYRKAEMVTLAALNYFSKLHPQLAGGLGVFPGIESILSEGSEAEANWRTIFGGLETAETESCRTITSPAAYLADMLHFIEKENPSAYAELKRRRPDIMNIELIHENTEIAMPYIDLVIELLEKYTAARKPGASINFSDSYQTISSAQDLKAYPDHLLESAYEDVLKKQVYPSCLPFDLALEEIRAYLNLFGKERHEIMDDFVPGCSGLEGAASNFHWAAEYLGLSYNEAKLLIGKLETGSPAQAIISRPWLLFGLDKENGFTAVPDPLDSSKTITGNWLAALTGRVDFLIQQMGISYVELLKLLDTDFINPPGAGGALTVAIVSEAAPDTAELNKLKLSGAGQDTLFNLVRFSRLTRKLNLEPWELDILFKVLQIKLIEEKDLVDLAYALMLIRNNNFKVDEAATLWCYINNRTYRDYDDPSQPEKASLFKRMFDNRSVLGETTGKLKELIDPSRKFKLVEVENELCSALGLAKAELDALMVSLNYADEDDDPGNVEIRLAELTKMTATVFCAGMTGVKAYEAADFAVLATTDPSLAPLKSWSYLNRMDLLKGYKFELEDLKSILLEKDELHASEEAQVFINALKKGIIDLKTQQSAIPDPAYTEEALKKYLAGRFAQQFKVKEAVAEALLTNLGSLHISGKQLMDDFLEKDFVESGKNIVFANPGGDVNNQAMPHLFYAYGLMEKSAWICTSLKLDGLETEALMTVPGLKVTDFNTLPLENDCSDKPAAFASFMRMVELIQARDMINDGDPGLISIYSHSIGANDKGILIGGLADLLGCHTEDLEYLAGKSTEPYGGILKARFNDGGLNDFLDFSFILRLARILHSAKYTGMTLENLYGIVKEGAGLTESALLRKASRSRFSEKEWFKAAGIVRNTLRDKQREALTAFVVANPNRSSKQYWKTHEDLFEYLLIDVDMTAKVDTSRIKQAISSVQLFVDRILLGIEKKDMLLSNTPFCFDKEQAREWNNWRKYYRIWEANRKIFLYPENWIEPELRDDKSLFFKQLESQLKQGELTDEAIEDAYFKYLQKLDQVAKMDVKCFYQEKDPDHDIDVLHIIGRTPSMPYTYHYRKRTDGEWSAWEPVNMDINGSNLAMVVWNRRLYLFWIELLEEPEKKDLTLTEGSAMTKTRLRYKLQLAWSNMWRGRWNGKKLSRESIYTEYFNDKTMDEIADRIFLSTRFRGTKLEVRPLTSLEIISPGIHYEPSEGIDKVFMTIGKKYTFTDSISNPKIEDDPDAALTDQMVIPKNTNMKKMKLSGDLSLWKDKSFSAKNHYISSVE